MLCEGCSEHFTSGGGRGGGGEGGGGITQKYAGKILKQNNFTV